MVQLRKNELAALGLVNRAPIHGYALNQAIQSMGLEHWTTLSRSSIYAALRKLERQGAVSRTHAREGNAPERTVYHIEPAGRTLLGEILREALSYVGPEDRYFYLGVAFAEALAPEDIIALLELRLARLREGIRTEKTEMAELEAAMPELAHMIAIMHAGVRHYEVELDVCTQLIELLRHSPEGFAMLKGACHGSEHHETA